MELDNKEYKASVKTHKVKIESLNKDKELAIWHIKIEAAKAN